MSLTDKLKYAFPRTVPVMAGYIFLGIAFGILLQQSGFSFIWAFFISLTVFAGSMQFAMIPLMTTMASPLLMAVTTLFVNSRHLFYGLSFIDSFKKIKERPYMIFSLTDETYSVLCGCKSEDPDEKMRDAWFFIALLDHSYWILGSVIGGLMGAALPIDFTGIDFSMTALFLVILIEQILSNPQSHLPVAIVGILASSILLSIMGADTFLLPSMVLTVFLVCVMSRRYSYVDKQ